MVLMADSNYVAASAIVIYANIRVHSLLEMNILITVIVFAIIYKLTQTVKNN